MSTVREPRRKKSRVPTLVDLSEQFGPMPAWRIRTNPHPGTATEKDLLHILEHEDSLCELVDGILVEKDSGYGELMFESELAARENLSIVKKILRTKTAPTLFDLSERFGPMPAWRIRTRPHPGTATEKDVLRVLGREDRLCELVDGILVEKDVGYEESYLAGLLLTYLNVFVMPRRLGSVTGEAGMVKLATGLVRIPDVAFVDRRRLPGGKVPVKPIPRLVPNLAVEILSRGNTPNEMQQKLREYFQAGVELVWFVDPRKRTVAVFTAADESTTLAENQTLTGGKVLPGFKLKLRTLFATLDE